MGEAAHSQGPLGAQGINGLICDLGIFLAFLQKPDQIGQRLDKIRQSRYRLNQPTLYSSLMHMGI